jgi:hypothetical protein
MATAMTTGRPPFPPFTRDRAIQKVRPAEDGWNTRDPAMVALAYAIDSRWRNRPKLPCGNYDCSQVGCLGRLTLRLAGLPTQEAQQFGVYFFRVRPRDAMRTVLHDQQARPFDKLGGARS